MKTVPVYSIIVIHSMTKRMTTKSLFQAALFITGLFFFSCNQPKEQEHPTIIAPKVMATIGYTVPNDSVTPPKVVVVDERKLKKVKAGTPKVVPTHTNVHPAGKPKIVLVGTPRVCIPGQDTFLVPKTVPAIDRPFAAGIPEVVIAKDALVKDQNPAGFSSFSKLQGLKHGDITCMLQDKNGNIWFGTNGGGVSKYDGKFFTHFTEKEGLSNNIVQSILEDKSGNIWFGTWGGGVSRLSREGTSFTHFTEKEGLSNNIVQSILEDKSGNIWFGTFGGGVSRLSREENSLPILPKKKDSPIILSEVSWKTKAEIFGSVRMVEYPDSVGRERPLRILPKKKASPIILFRVFWKTKTEIFGSVQRVEAYPDSVGRELPLRILPKKKASPIMML
nr:two-component regulator propeller domain-containing protein [Haliscomenobacter sp.]